MPLPKLLRDLLALPTAPFAETHVLTYVEKACRKLNHVTLKRDPHGNLLAHYKYKPRKVLPLCFVAHADHPGFIAIEMLDPHTLRAEFRGGVRPEFFEGSPVRFWHNNEWISCRIKKLTKTGPPPAPHRPRVPKEAHLHVEKEVAAGSLGMWDLPDPALDGDRIVARACDDLAGLGALLALLQRLSRNHVSAEVYGLFTRAEEVGFVGAVGAIKSRTVPRHIPVVSIETSSVLPGVAIGGGPIIRVGDRMLVYTPELATFATRVAQDLQKHRKKFQYQRKLMDGGMCEAAAFGSFGYLVTGICIALGNYHNMDTDRGVIASEWVSLADWHHMVDLFEALVRDEQGPGAKNDALRKRIDGLYRDRAMLLK